MSTEPEERWPIAKDIALAIGIGFVLAMYLLPTSRFLAVWFACSSGAFFAITLRHTLDQPSWVGETIWFLASGAVGGAVWWLVSDQSNAAWEAIAGGVAIVALGLLIEIGLPKILGRDV